MGQLTDVCLPWPFQPDNPVTAVLGSLHQDLCKSSEPPEAEALWLVSTDRKCSGWPGSSSGVTEPPVLVLAGECLVKESSAPLYLPVLPTSPGRASVTSEVPSVKSEVLLVSFYIQILKNV